MPLAYLTFFSGLAISAVAIYYSVIGLAAIFAAAVVPIMVMGTILELSKLVAAWWLKSNWHRAPFLLKSYMLIAVIVLMLITSMGIFGFLSKAHTDQAIPLGDTASQVAFIDEKINNERETISNARSLLKQLDDAVIGIQSGDGRELRMRDGSTRQQSASEYALTVRRSQANDRAALTKTIEEAQARIVALQEEKAPIASQLRAVEAEVGPIKYIAKLIYGDNPDSNLLEKAVVWVIIIIVLVFDPLAVLLLLSSQLSFQWARNKGYPEPEDTGYKHGPWPFDENDNDYKVDEENINSQSETKKHQIQDNVDVKSVLDDAKKKLAQFNLQKNKFETKLQPLNVTGILENVLPPEIPSTSLTQPVKNDTSFDGIDAWNKMIEEAEREIIEENSSINVFPEPVDQSSVYVQNEEQIESNLWQETRNNVKVDQKDSLSQEDYQIKVNQAIIRDLIKNLNDGKISVTDLTEEEIKNIEEYLRENNDRENNTDKST